MLIKLTGIKLSVNISTIRDFLRKFKSKKGKTQVEVGELIEIHETLYRVYDSDHEKFSAFKEDK